MREKMSLTVVKVKYIKDIEELEFGHLYYLDGEVYVYSGKGVVFPGAFMFVCPDGTLFANKKMLTNSIELKQFYEVRQIHPHKSVEK